MTPTLRHILRPALGGTCVLLCLAGGSPAAAQAVQVSVPTPLTFEAALDLAASRNLGVEAVRRQRAIRDASIRAARAIPNPDVSFEASKDTPHQALTFAMPLEIGGTRSRRIDLATEERTLADLDLQAELRTVRHDVRQAFYSLVAADERVRLADAVLAIARSLRDAAQARFETGAAPRLEVLQADLGVTRADTELDLARAVRVAAQASLCAVLNLPPQQALAISGSLSDGRSAIGYEQALALATTSNTDLLSLDRQMAIEQRRVVLLGAGRRPTPTFWVSGLFDFEDPEVGPLPAAGVSVTLPLFSRSQGEIAGSVATTSALRGRRDATRRAVENGVFGTIARIDAERRQVEAYEQQLVPTATSLETLAEESYRAGRTSVLGVLDAQRSLRDLGREALQAALDLQLSLADLEELLGTPLP